MRRLIPLVLAPALAVVPLAASSAAPAPAPPAPAPPAAPPAPAPAPPADLAGEVARTAQELEAGTRRLQEQEAVLADLTRRAQEVRAQAQVAGERAERTRETLHDTVGAAYRSPQAGQLARTLTDPRALADPQALAESLRATASLEQVQGRQEDLLRVADDDRRRAQALVQEADRLAAQAAEQSRAVAAEVAALRARAEDARVRFEAAAAAAAADQAARAAAAARADRDRAPALPAPPPGAAPGACGGGALDGYPNGMLPAEALCPLDGFPGLLLRADAAAAFNRMAAAGGMPCAGNSYRSYGEQVALYRVKPDLAAVPGTSNHGWGVAVDFACGAESFGTPAYAWLKANGPLYGWTHPDWAEPGGSRPEPWHWEYTG